MSLLGAAVPIAGAATRVAIGPELLTNLGPKIDLMEKVTSALLKDVPDLVARPTVRGGPDEEGLRNTAEGAGLRELHSLLLTFDGSRKWGGLRRVLTPTGDSLWLCQTHYHEYEPPLPVL